MYVFEYLLWQNVTVDPELISSEIVQVVLLLFCTHVFIVLRSTFTQPFFYLHFQLFRDVVAGTGTGNLILISSVRPMVVFLSLKIHT